MLGILPWRGAEEKALEMEAEGGGGRKAGKAREEGRSFKGEGTWREHQWLVRCPREGSVVGAGFT